MFYWEEIDKPIVMKHLRPPFAICPGGNDTHYLFFFFLVLLFFLWSGVGSVIFPFTSGYFLVSPKIT